MRVQYDTYGIRSRPFIHVCVNPVRGFEAQTKPNQSRREFRNSRNSALAKRHWLKPSVKDDDGEDGDDDDVGHFYSF